MGLKINTLTGSISKDAFGYDIAVGDINGDSKNEIIISSTGIKGGMITVYSDTFKLIKKMQIGNKKVNTIRLLTVDINKDNVDELVIAVTYQDLSGEVRVLSLNNKKVLYRWKSIKDYDAFGFAIASGDVDGDGIPDIIVSAPQPIKNGKGTVYLFSGKDGSLIREFTSRIPREHNNFGTSVTSGDINNDGIDEVIIGAPGTPKGQVLIYSAKHGWLVQNITGKNPGFGINVHIDDLFGDNNKELIITTKHLKGNKVSVFKKKNRFRTLSHLYDIENDEVDIGFGETITTGDINGDGKKELIIGAFDAHRRRNKYTGQVNVYNSEDGKLIHKWFGKTEKDQFGFSLATGKFNNSEKDSILIGTPREILGKKGLVYVTAVN